MAAANQTQSLNRLCETARRYAADDFVVRGQANALVFEYSCIEITSPSMPVIPVIDTHAWRPILQT
jgi:hypothetical protein